MFSVTTLLVGNLACVKKLRSEVESIYSPIRMFYNRFDRSAISYGLLASATGVKTNIWKYVSWQI